MQRQPRLLRMSPEKDIHHARELFLRRRCRTMAAGQFGTLGLWEVCCEKVVDATMKRYRFGAGHDQNRSAKASEAVDVIGVTRDRREPAKS